MKPLTSAEILAIEANLFRAARPIVRGRPEFPWHRDRRGAVTAGQLVSSQALAVDFFGTIDALASRDAIVNGWMADLRLPFSGPWRVEFEVLVSRRLLGEPRPSQIDVGARGSNGLVLFECKFTEPDGGCCSQPIPIANGQHRGVRQCDGNFAEQVNPVTGTRSRCPLTSKGVKYWEIIPDVLAVDPRREYRPCPFAGGWYQWMRNLVAARAIGLDYRLPSAFVVTYTEGPFPMARKVATDDWTQFNTLADGRTVPFRTTSYQQLHALALATASDSDRQTLRELQPWIDWKTVSASVKAESA